MATQENPKSNLSSNPQAQKIRIVAKIRGFTANESQCSKPWISVFKTNQSDRVAISFSADQPTSRKEVYEVDHCYEQNVDMGLIFSREIKPLIPAVFEGKKVTLVGLGARGTGKTYAIEGSEQNTGLATLAVAEILSMAEMAGKFVTISVYEICKDNVHDVLGQNHPKVQVLENDQGEIILKGLSQVSVRTITEFQKLYHGEGSTVKPAQKLGLEQSRRSHKGLMIHILSSDEPSNMKIVGKMNFVDLSGYEDSRRKGNNVETTIINKSLYAFLNVVNALSKNENRIPYRESKLTRVLQDSLGGTNRVLILACLNPIICQDTAYVISLASRACHGINPVLSDFTNRSKSSAKPTVVSSMKNVKPVSLSATTKKHTNSRVNFSQNKRTFAVEGRKLFNDRKQSSTSEQKTPLPSSLETDSNAIVEKESLSSITYEEATGTSVTAMDPQMENNHIADTPNICNDTKTSTLLEEDNIEKESMDLVMDKGESPPLSARLKELSNNLKSLCASTPLCVTKPQEVDTPYSGQIVGYVNCVEPKTPIVERFNEKSAIAMHDSPWESFSARSSGMKQSLVQSYLQFLNTASKEDLKGIRGIGEKRATYILELREESPEPFKSLDDLQDIGLTTKQIKHMMKTVAGELFS